MIAGHQQIDQNNKGFSMSTQTNYHSVTERDLTERKVIDAIKWIEPNNHDTRVIVSFALKTEFGDVQWAWLLFDSWYQTYSRYSKHESQSIWKSSRPGSIGIGSLFRFAKDRGWRWVDSDNQNNNQENKKWRDDQKIIEEKAKATQHEIETQAVSKAQAILDFSKVAVNSTPYLKQKGVQATSTLFEINTKDLKNTLGYTPRGSTGNRLTGRLLVAPFWKLNDLGTLELSTLELIDQSGNKSALKGGRKSGAFWVSGVFPQPDAPEDSRVVIVAEGVATTLSLAMATGYTAVACGSISNFEHVLNNLREAMPWLRLILGADVEKTTGTVPEKLQKTADKHSAVLIAPVFGKGRSIQQTDFNDLYLEKGLDIVREQVNAMIYSYDFRNRNKINVCETKESSNSLTLAMQEILNRYAIVLLEGKACIVYREKNQLGQMETKFSNPKDMRYMWSDVKVFENSTSKMSAFDYWMLNRKKYNQVVFSPTTNHVQDDENLPDSINYNLYQGLTFKPKPGDCKRIIKHIKEVWCNDDNKAFEYVMGWLARMFQHPNERGHTVLLLNSGEGTGKNIIVDMLVRAFGQHAMIANKPDDLVGKFNDQLATSVLVFANEAVWGGNKSLEGALKTLITDEELVVEKKYIPKYRIKNCCHVIMASNNDWAAPIGLDDRRFVVLNVSDKYQGNHAYFTALQREIEQRGQAAFIHMLLNWDISEFNPRELPELNAGQDAKLDMKLKSADSITQWWFDVLWAGEAWILVETGTGGRARRNIMVNWDVGAVQVKAEDLRNAYQQWCGQHRRHVESEVTFGRKLSNLCSIERRRLRVDGERVYVYQIRDIGTVRQEVRTKVRQAVTWPELDVQC